MKKQKNKIVIEAFNLKKNNTGIGFYIKSLLDNFSVNFFHQQHLVYINKDVVSQVSDKEYSYLKSGNKIIEIIYKHFILGLVCNFKGIQLFHGTSYYIPKFIKSKTVVTVHDLSYIHYPQVFTRSRILYGKIFIKDSLKRADKIIAVSESTKQDIIKYYDIKEEKISVIYLAAREIFTPATVEEINNIKKKYNLERYILSVGTIEPRKNLISLLRAFKLKKDKIGKDVKLVLVGQCGWLYDGILDEVKEIQDRIVMTGYISDEELKAMYSGAEVFVYPSLYEGFGLPVLESLACGTPVITSNISSLPEVVGLAGVLVNPLNIDEIGNAIINQLENCNKEEQKKIALSQSKKFSWKRCAEETQSIYDALLNIDKI